MHVIVIGQDYIDHFGYEQLKAAAAKLGCTIVSVVDASERLARAFQAASLSLHELKERFDEMIKKVDRDYDIKKMQNRECYTIVKSIKPIVQYNRFKAYYIKSSVSRGEWSGRNFNKQSG